MGRTCYGDDTFKREASLDILLVNDQYHHTVFHEEHKVKQVIERENSNQFSEVMEPAMPC
ncbi:uncharacterized protein CLUP02_07421 [Colletotrichum lupini]|uniref:Uncharacterized protein n=1 Tax=Colletotrichum lupini TaxID=145971 RepID=A0A9Q8WGN0_9PEZI|nr:uncharacterized protein CLUP02_07421 [Colletotrichum lupini]UQC81935.1 hypothetical protein CLUP02_07421 [Colletotrichum lupini]